MTHPAAKLRFGSLFAGIGGFDLGFERAGMECAWQVEIDDYCNRVLAKHWPEVKRYGDVRECGKHNLEPVDLICGGFPCQPYSVAGKQRGEADDRNLWPEFLRIVREVRPAWVVAENVPGIIPLYLDTVLSDLEGEDYTCWTFNIPACALDAPHRRERIFIMAYYSKYRLEKGWATSRFRSERPTENSWWAVEPDVGRVAHGIPNRVDRLRALGNAIVPQVAEWIGRRIVEVASRR